MDLYLVFIYKIIRNTQIKLKNVYIVKFEFETLYVQLRNDPVGWRKVLLNKSNEVTKSDVCIQEIRQRRRRQSQARFECKPSARFYCHGDHWYKRC